MSYEERTLGWRGVGRAMERERVTRSNCDAGRFTRGPVLRDIAVDARIYFVSGRIVALAFQRADVFDATTGDRLAYFATDDHYSQGLPICDRWIPLCSATGKVTLFDCVTMNGLKAPVAFNPGPYCRISVSGQRASFRNMAKKLVHILHVQISDNDSGTVARPFAKIAFRHTLDEFELVEHGQSYLSHDFETKTLQLMDIDTQQCKRVFTPHDGFVIGGFKYSRECGFVVVKLDTLYEPYDSDEPPPLEDAATHGSLVFRIDDGHCMDQRFIGHLMPCHNGRCYRASGHNKQVAMVDAMTGERISKVILNSPVCDTSGAALGWNAFHGGLMSTSGTEIEFKFGHIELFRNGVCVIHTGDSNAYNVLFFNQ